MKWQVNELIDALSGDANFYAESDNAEHRELATRFDLTAKCLLAFQNTLLSIARNQNGIPAHQAQDVLKETGHCGHISCVYRAGSGPNESRGFWICHDCKKESCERLVPFE